MMGDDFDVNFDFDSFNYRSSQPNFLNCDVKSILLHLSLMLGKDICQYPNPYPSQISSVTSDVNFPIANLDENLVAEPSTKILAEKWANAFIPLHPFQFEVSSANFLEIDDRNEIKTSSAKRNASLRRERDGNGKFKRCTTKWVTAPEFFETNL